MSTFKNPSFGRSNETVNQQQENGNDTKKEKYTFHLAKPEEFPSFADTAAMVTNALAQKLNEFFSLAYKDFYGTKIFVSANGAFLETKLYFSKNINLKSDAPLGFDDFINNKKSGIDLLDRLNGIGSRPLQKMYNPTQELKDGLARFLFGYSENNMSFKPDWNRLIFEETEQTSTGTVTYAVVTGFDIKKILPEIYGRTDETGDGYFYDININRPTSFIGANGMMLPMSSIDYLITIPRIRYSELKKLANAVGVAQIGNSLGIVRAR